MKHKSRYKVFTIFVFCSFINTGFVFAQLKNTTEKKLDTTVLKSTDYVFFVIGDWGRDGSKDQTQVSNAMKKCATVCKPRFIISTGDQFYCCGVNSADDPKWVSSYENVYNENLLPVKWYPVLGNHEYFGNPQALIDYSKKSTRWTMPDRYYTFEDKNDNQMVRFLFIDTSPFVHAYRKAHLYSDVGKQDTLKQLRYMDSVLNASKGDAWKIVIGHHPVYSSGAMHGDTKELKSSLEPLLKKNDVQFYLCGHDHNLQYQKPLGSYTDYIVSGAGSDIRKTSKNINTKFSKSTPGFVIICLRKETMYVYFVDKDLNIVYQYERINNL